MTNIKKNVSIVVGIFYVSLAIITILSLMIKGGDLIFNNINIFMFIFLILATCFAALNFKSFIRQFETFKRNDIIMLSILLILLLFTSFMWQDDLFGVMTTITGVLCVFQVARGNKWNFFWGALNVFFYAVYAYRADYAGDFLLNALYYFPMQFIGIYFWTKNYMNKEDVVVVRRFTPFNYAVTIISVAVGTIVLTYLMPAITSLFNMGDNPLPLVDSFTTTGSIAAQIIMTKRFREQWILWIVVNAFAVVMWVYKGDAVMAIMWGAYFINAVYGLKNWSKQ